jgi:4-hydroxybenzoate polyprenyltransferase
MGLTGIAPVLGAVSMWNNGQLSILELFILFIIGCLSHIFGFVLNDVVDVKLDRLSKELSVRPLVSGKITKKKAFYFLIFCMILSFILSIFFYNNTTKFVWIISILVLAYIFATIYNLTSKKYPGMDFFVAGAVFFLIIFGASTIGTPTSLAWIVAFIGGLQVLFMNLINGTIKDIDHDLEGKVNTLAIKLGAHSIKGKIVLPLSFKTIGFLIETVRIILLFIPFIFFSHPYYFLQLGIITIIIIFTYFSIYYFFSITTFNRDIIRKTIGIIVILMFMSTPIMLSSLNIFIIILAIIPPIWFIICNIIIHNTLLEPKTM